MLNEAHFLSLTSSSRFIKNCAAWGFQFLSLLCLRSLGQQTSVKICSTDTVAEGSSSLVIWFLWKILTCTHTLQWYWQLRDLATTVMQLGRPTTNKATRTSAVQECSLLDLNHGVLTILTSKQQLLTSHQIRTDLHWPKQICLFLCFA